MTQIQFTGTREEFLAKAREMMTEEDIEAVAWRWRADDSRAWMLDTNKSRARGLQLAHGYEVQPLYLHPSYRDVDVKGAEHFVGSCPSCNGTGDQGGNPSYGVCEDCNGAGLSALQTPHKANPK